MSVKKSTLPSQSRKKSGRKTPESDRRRFLGKPLISIDIGQYTTKLVFGQALKPTLVEIKKAFSFPTPSGSVDRGRIMDIDPLAKQIENVIRAEKIKAAFVFCTIENAEIITREIVLPTADENDMESMLEYEVQQYMPVDLENYIIQSKMLNSITEGGTSKTRFLATAVLKDMVQSYYDLIHKINLKASILDIQSNAIDKLIASEMAGGRGGQFPADASIAVVDFGYSHINAILIEDGKYQFNRYIDQGAVNIDRSLVSVFGYSEEEINDKKHDAIDLRLTASVLSEGDDSIDQLTMREVNVVQNIVHDWANELERVFRFYSSLSTGRFVEKIFIHGGAAQLTGLEEYLFKLLGIPVERICTPNCVRVPDNVKNITPYLNAIGAFFRR